MLYTYIFTVPANTPKSSPKKMDVTLKHGVIRRIMVTIPAGHSGLAHMIIKWGETQIIPHEGDICGDDEKLEWEEYYEIIEDERTLTLVGWNEDVENDHSFIVRFEVLPREIVYPHLYILETLQKAFRRIRIPL